MQHPISDRTIKALLKGHAPEMGKKDKYGRRELIDQIQPGFGLRWNGKKKVTFLVFGRFGGSSVRRTIGDYGASTNRAARIYTLAAARAEAEQWLIQRRAGTDPKQERDRALEARARERTNIFERVAEDFIREKVLGPECYDEWQTLEWKTSPKEHDPIERKGFEIARDIRRDLIPIWGKRPVVQITDGDVQDAIEAKAKTAPAQARNLLGTAKRLFTWAKLRRRYGLTASPIADLKPRDVVGDKRSVERILNDDELFALWRAVGRLPYPHGPVYRLLILSALRLNEAADASKLELDRKNKLWIIPKERMKGKNGKAREHAVPLIDPILAVFDALPKYGKGDFLFTTTFGAKPVWMSDKVKKRLDARMLRTLKAMAVRDGHDPAKVRLLPWTNHDIRRTVRSNLSRLKVSEEAREAVMAHARPGIKGTYDLYDYLDEKREALTLWAARVSQIVAPQGGNVVVLPQVKRNGR